MYAPRGFGRSELGKFDILAAENGLHLFALTLPNHDVVLHAVSADGLAWRELPNALYCGDPGTPDDDEIWSVSVAGRDGNYTMLYTGLARADDGLVQRTLRATSPDLVRWTKDARGVVAAPDPRWYGVGPQPGGRVSWRDPKPVRVGDGYLAPLCAHECAGPPLRRGCVGLLTSPDLVSWEVRPPLLAPRRGWDLECPQIFAIDGAWYLTAAVADDRSQRYWAAPAPGGPFRTPPDGGLLAPPGHYAGRVCRWRESDLLFSQVTAGLERPGGGHATGKFVAPPLALRRRPDGSLARHSAPGWLPRLATPPLLIAPSSPSHFQGRQALGDGWHLDAPGAMDVLATAEAHADLRLEGLLLIEAAAGGLAVGLDERGGGLFIEIARGAATVALRRWVAGPARAGDRPFRYAEVQSAPLPAAARSGQPLPFAVLVAGHYIECSLADEVVLAAVVSEPPAGRVGVWADDGEVRAWGMTVAPLHPPDYDPSPPPARQSA